VLRQNTPPGFEIGHASDGPIKPQHSRRVHSLEDSERRLRRVTIRLQGEVAGGAPEARLGLFAQTLSRLGLLRYQLLRRRQKSVC